MIRRRHLLLPALLSPPGGLRAQRRAYRLGVLSAGQVAVDMVRALVLPELARLGFVEDRNLDVVVRVSDGLGAPLDAAAAELLALRPDVVSAASLVAVQALLALDSRTPIVMFGSAQLVGSGLARSFARPGGNVTGVVLLPEELNLKRLELARAAFPSARVIGYLGGAGTSAADREALQAEAARLGVTLRIVISPRPGDEPGAIAALHAAGAGVVVVGASPVLASRAAVIAAEAASRAMPTICEWRYMADAGCTISYGPQHEPLRRRHAQQIARILRGEPPATIPIEIADRFELAVNLRAARQLGVEFPPLLLARADEVIE